MQILVPLILCNGMAILGIDSMVRLGIGLLLHDIGDLPAMRFILDGCI